MNKEIFKNKKVISSIISTLLVVTFLIIFFATDCSAKVFKNKEYKVYEYAIECVEDDLKYPDAATYPSFKKTSIEKSKYGASIIIDSYSGGKSFEEAWDVRGSGTCENALGMTMNYTFTVTVVMDEYGDLWCYKCVVI